MDNYGLVRAAVLNDLPPHMEIAVAYLARYHKGTFQLYKRYLYKFLTWCESEGLDPLVIKRGHIELYIRQLMNSGLQNSTVNTIMTPVKGYYKMAYMDGIIDRDPAVYAKLPKEIHHKKPIVDRDEIKKFLVCASLFSNRHWALSQLLGVMGLRVSEACSLSVESALNVEQGIRVIRYIGKGDKFSSTPIPYQSLASINAVIDNRKTGKLLTRKDGQPLTRAAAYGMMQTISRKCGSDISFNPHYLRALAITQGKEAGLDLIDLQKFARHEDPRTTQRHYILGEEKYGSHPVHAIGARLAI